jgi:membrane protein implicated in regulation of membrane protease activity
MNPRMEKELETQIGLALQALPDLAAPPGLLARTMSALEQPVPWPARPWAKWPASARIAFFIFALAAVAAAFVAWRALEPGLLAAVSRRLAPAASDVKCLWNIFGALAGAVVLVVEHLGNGFMLACLAVVAAACAVCAGFGTIFVRLALARPGRNQL